MGIKSTHPAYDLAAPRWKKNRDVCIGSDAVKRLPVDNQRCYLPDDNLGKAAPEADPTKYTGRYARLVARAFFMPFAQHTRNGLIGMVYSKPPTIELPSGLDYIIENADGAGQSLEQLGKRLVSDGIEVGRAGLIADYPNHGIANPSRHQLEGIRPSIQFYNAESIQDWDTETFSGVTVLTFVKLREIYTERSQDGWSLGIAKNRYRVLRLRNGIYTQELLDDSATVITPEFSPLQNGSEMDHIPFFFVGSENNKPDADGAPISGIVDCNISHYQNSADLEQNVHIHAGSTLVITTETTPDQFTKANPQGVTIGANEGLNLGKSGSAELLQLQSDSASSQLMEAKERQAEALGAVYATNSDAKNVTAEAARINAAQSTSTLTTLVGNISEAVQAALIECARFQGLSDVIEFALNQDFHAETLDPQFASLLQQGVDLEFINQDQARELWLGMMGKLGLEIQATP